MMTDRVTDWVIITIIWGILWLFNYRGHLNMQTSQRPVTNLPRWMRLVSGHPNNTAFDLHSLVGQITSFCWWLAQTIAVFIPSYTKYRHEVQLGIMIVSLITGAIYVSILNRFYRTKP